MRGLAVVGLVVALATSATAAPGREHGSMEVTIRAKTTRLRVGDEIPIEVTLTNHGQTALSYGRDLLGRPLELDFAITDASGAAVPLARRNEYATDDRPVFIAPGTSSTSTEYLGLWAKLRTPGKLTVVAELRVEGQFRHGERVVRSGPLHLELAPATDRELAARIAALGKGLETATTYADREPLLRRLIVIGRLDAAKVLVEAMYASPSSSLIVEAFRFLVDLPGDFRETFLAIVARRGLTYELGFFFALLTPPATTDELFQIITAALASDREAAQQEGATLALDHPDDRYVPRLIALASGTTQARWSAIRALAVDRTDAGVACLRLILAGTDVTAHITASQAVIEAYLTRDKVRPGHRLEPGDFPDIEASAIGSAPVTLEAQVDTGSQWSRITYDVRWQPVETPGSLLTITSPGPYHGRALTVFHDRGSPPIAGWTSGARVRFAISRYYLDHPDTTMFEGALRGAELLGR